MKHLKKLLSFLLFGILCTSFSLKCNAAPYEEQYSNIAEYNLSSTESQTFELKDAKGNIYSCTISPLSGNVSRVKNGRYKVSYTIPNKWNASFIVSISSNKISSLSSPSTTAIMGSITNTSLVKESSTKAALKFKYTLAGIQSFTGFRCYISDNTLKTQKI